MNAMNIEIKYLTAIQFLGHYCHCFLRPELPSNIPNLIEQTRLKHYWLNIKNWGHV